MVFLMNVLEDTLIITIPLPLFIVTRICWAVFGLSGGLCYIN